MRLRKLVSCVLLACAAFAVGLISLVYAKGLGWVLAHAPGVGSGALCAPDECAPPLRGSQPDAVVRDALGVWEATGRIALPVWIAAARCKFPEVVAAAAASVERGGSAAGVDALSRLVAGKTQLWAGLVPGVTATYNFGDEAGYYAAYASSWGASTRNRESL